MRAAAPRLTAGTADVGFGSGVNENQSGCHRARTPALAEPIEVDTIACCRERFDPAVLGCEPRSAQDASELQVEARCPGPFDSVELQTSAHSIFSSRARNHARRAAGSSASTSPRSSECGSPFGTSTLRFGWCSLPSSPTSVTRSSASGEVQRKVPRLIRFRFLAAMTGTLSPTSAARLGIEADHLGVRSCSRRRRAFERSEEGHRLRVLASGDEGGDEGRDLRVRIDGLRNRRRRRPKPARCPRRAPVTNPLLFLTFVRRTRCSSAQNGAVSNPTLSTAFAGKTGVVLVLDPKPAQLRGGREKSFERRERLAVSALEIGPLLDVAGRRGLRLRSIVTHTQGVGAR